MAAYCRVSSDSDDQRNSFSTQVQHYTQLIQSHPDWEFVDIYADEGITGTRADKRDDFQRLMADCRAGKIDQVLVKSLSRFARNSKDCIQAVRELQSLGISVFFEKEHLDTGKLHNEMTLSMMSVIRSGRVHLHLPKYAPWGAHADEKRHVPYLPDPLRLPQK